jgi:hypothetical protein
MDMIKKLWNDHPKKKWLIVGLVIGWAAAQFI